MRQSRTRKTQKPLVRKNRDRVPIRPTQLQFFHAGSPTLAGGTVIYTKDTPKTIPRPELKIDLKSVESYWAEIDPCNNKKYTVNPRTSAPPIGRNLK